MVGVLGRLPVVLLVCGTWRSGTSLSLTPVSEGYQGTGRSFGGRGGNNNHNLDCTMSNFEFLHPTIAQVLAGPAANGDDSTSWSSYVYLRPCHADSAEIVLDFPETAALNDLVALACECDQWIYKYPANRKKEGGDHESQSIALSFGHFGMQLQPSDYWLMLANSVLRNDNTADADESADTTMTNMVPTLLALNGLESAIRNATGYTTSKAPLLKTMIRELKKNDPSSRSLHHACSLLLTPRGLNLRNLLWHGFVTEEVLPRPWLSLVLTLTLILQQQLQLQPNLQANKASAVMADESHSPKQRTLDSSSLTVMDIRDVPEFTALLESARPNLLTDPTSLIRDDDQQYWLPPSHQALYENVVVPWLKTRQRPATCCALLSILLEHGLRLDWCRANQRPDDTLARPNTFYVTLDGHGQRQIHDLLLHPYLTTTNEEGTAAIVPNALIENGELPASTLALLTDLCCSSCGGPNIRAAVSHGSWDQYLESEWCCVELEQSSEDRQHKDRLWDLARFLLLAMDAVAARGPIAGYLPAFSYTAVTRRAVLDCQMSLHKLIWISKDGQAHNTTHESQATLSSNGVPHELLELQPTASTLKIQTPLLGRICDEWTTDCVFEEHDLNLRLAEAGLTRTLLQDVATASRQLLEDVEDSYHRLATEPSAHTRKQKSWLRMVGSSRETGLVLYTLALNVAILSVLRLEDNDDPIMIKALERTRMVVSTTQNFLREKVDRANKTIVEYTKGKAIQEVAHRIQVEKNRQSMKR